MRVRNTDFRSCRRTFYFCVCVGCLYVVLLNVIIHVKLSHRSDKELTVGKLRISWGKSAMDKEKLWPCKKAEFSSDALPLTALASFPGSGNTWLRHLIQQATGLATGSVYRDFALKLYGFPGEGIANSSVIAVKTHEWGPVAQAPFQKCILLVREPYGALLAEYNRRHAGHRGRANSSNFGRAWREFVHLRSREWQEMIFDWLKFPGKIYILRYENLNSDLSGEMRRLFHFLSVNVTTRDFNCMLNNSEGLFHRTASDVNYLNHFNNNMKLKMDALWLNASNTLEKYVNTS